MIGGERKKRKEKTVKREAGQLGLSSAQQTAVEAQFNGDRPAAPAPVAPPAQPPARAHATATAHRVAAAAAANQLVLWRRRRHERRRGDSTAGLDEMAARRADAGVVGARRLVGGRPERERQHGGPCFEPRGGRLLLDRRLVAGVRGGALGARVGAVVHDVEEQRVTVRALHLLARLAALRVPVRAPEVGSARIGWSPWGSINYKMTKNM